MKKKKLVIELSVGDVIYTGRFKNKKTKIREFGIDAFGQPTVNGKTILKGKVEKLIPFG